MASVTIEGSLSPAAFLARGERRKVQRTKRIDKLIEKGFIVVIDEDTDQPDPEQLPHVEPLKSPGKSASRETWVEFLANQEPPVDHDPDATRDELVDAWENRPQ